MPVWLWGSLRLSFSAAIRGKGGMHDLYLNLKSKLIKVVINI